MGSGPRSPQAQVATLMALAAYGNFAISLGGLCSPFLADEFQLADAEITFLAGCISLGTFGTFALTRLADRAGRQGVLIACFGAIGPLSLATALAPGVVSYALLQIAMTGLVAALLSVVIVVVSEEVPEETRAAGQAYLGFFGALGAGLILMLMPAFTQLEGTWRWAFALGALPLLALPWVRRALPETARFERAAARGAIRASRMNDLFRGAYRRRAVGLLLAGTLRPVALIALGSWSYYHIVQTLELAPWVASLIFLLGGGLGLGGNAIGVRMSNRWGRRPTHALCASLTVATGIFFYWIPGWLGWLLPFALGLTFFLNQTAMHAFGVADRCLDTELFPTQLRATYAGWCRLAVALAATVANFALSGLSFWLGGLPLAVTVLSVAAFAPSLVIFLAVAPETRGLSLDEAALELAPTSPPDRPPDAARE
jgi:predicted MFS family arabinose efflux permease